MLAVTILFLALVAKGSGRISGIAGHGESTIFLVSGAFKFDGLFIPDDSLTYFKRVGGANPLGNFIYLWRDGKRWKMGYGKTFKKEASGEYYADTIEPTLAPPTRGWKTSLYDSRAPSIRVEQPPSLVSSLNQALAERGSFTRDYGVVCQSQAGWNIWDWVFLTKDRLCDMNKVHCKNLMDQVQCLVSTSNQTMEDIINGDWNQLGYRTNKEGGSLTKEGGVLCKDTRYNKWIRLRKDQVCGNEVRCRNLTDQLPCLVSTLDRTKAEGGSFTMNGGVLCQSHWGGEWVHLTKDMLCNNNIHPRFTLGDFDMVHCKNLMDQQPCLVSTLNHTKAYGGSFTVGGGVLCHGTQYPGARWVLLKRDRLCDKKIHCKNEMDETVCFEKKMNQTQTIILNGVGSAFTGVYSLQHWHGIEFYSQVGKLGLIYKLSMGRGLVIGSGENVWSATAVYRRERETVWKSVGDGSMAGRLYGTTAPEVQFTLIPDSFNKSLLGNIQFEKEETIEGVGVICFGSKNQEKTFIAFNNTEAGWCDMTWQCQFGGVLYSFDIITIPHCHHRYLPYTLPNCHHSHPYL